MIFHQNLSTEDILAFRKNAKKTSKQLKNRYLLVGAISSIIYFLYLLYKTYTVPDIYFIELFPTYSKWGFYVFHLASFIFIIYPLLVELSYYRTGSPVFIKGTNIMNERKINVDEQGISIESTGDSKTYKWEDILRVSEDEIRYFLYVTDSKAIIINRETINLTEAQLIQLNQLLRDNTKNPLPLKDKFENSKVQGIWSLRNKLLLVCIYVFLTGISSQDWGITLKEASKEVEKLFIDGNKVGEDKEITENLTQDKINQAKQMVLNVRDIGNYELEKSFEIHDLHIDIYRAQTQLNKKLGIPEETTIKSFSGESETWQINDYKIEIDPKGVRTSPGTISMKGEQSFMADYFKVEAHISFKDVRSGEDLTIGAFELTPEKPTIKNGEITDAKIGELNIAEQTTSHTFRTPILNNYNEPVSLDDILSMYFVIEWKGLQDSTNKIERVFLKPNGD